LSGLIGAFVLSFTVIFVVALGIVSAYGAVILILHTLVRQPRQSNPAKSALVPKAQAAHAGGD